MHTHVYVSIGKEVSIDVKDAILAEFKKHHLRINNDKPSGIEKIGFKIHLTVPDQQAFEKQVKELIRNLSYLYIIAPLKCLESLKHHPRIKCYDTSFIKDPTIAASVLIKYAYHGFPL